MVGFPEVKLGTSSSQRSSDFAAIATMNPPNDCESIDWKKGMNNSTSTISKLASHCKFLR